MAEIAMRAAKQATFIVDQQSCPFKVSGVDFMKLVDNKEYNKFHNRTGISFEPTSIDTSPSLNDWVGVKTQVEIVTVSQRRYA